MFFKFNGVFEYLIPASVLLGVLLGGYVLRKLLFNWLHSVVKNTETHLDDIVISAIKGPFIIWCAMFGIYLALDVSKLPESLVAIAGKILVVLAIISVTMVLSNISSSIISTYSSKLSGPLPVTTLTQNITRIVIYLIGILIILNRLGVSITPILATLGVGGLAVALAMQDTLSNLFAGFHLIVSGQIKVGDYIKLENNIEGYVVDINWRITKIKMLPNNIILIPNAKLTQAIITNFHMPEKELAVLVNVGVHYDSDLERVEKITIEVAKEVMKDVQGGVPGFEPFVRYHTFADFSINFTVIMRAKEFVDQYLVKHEFVKRLHARYAKEKIVIPYPIRAVNYSQEKSPENPPRG